VRRLRSDALDLGVAGEEGAEPQVRELLLGAVGAQALLEVLEVDVVEL
jgi:hypothetical protein